LDVPTTSDLLLAYPFSRLNLLHVQFPPNYDLLATKDQLIRFFKILHCVSPSLEDLQVWFDEDGYDIPLDYHILQYPFAYLPLRRIQLVHRYPIKFTSSEVVQVAKALGPTITDLYLGAYPTKFPKDKHQLTLDDLVPFAQYCPNLEQLALYLNAEVKGTIEDIEVQFPPALRVLDFGESKISDHSCVVDFLVKMGAPAIYVDPVLNCPQSRATWLVVEKVMDKLRTCQKTNEAKLDALSRKLEDLEAKLKKTEDR
jgi:hypothetical protein